MSNSLHLEDGPALQSEIAGPADYGAVSSDNLDFIQVDRRDGEYEKALRHAKRVKILKFALPIFGVIIIIAMVLALIINSFLSGPIEIGAITLDEKKLVMEKPNLNGVDRNNRPFQLSADRAIQDITDPTKVELSQISATLPLEDGISASVKAEHGSYDSVAKTLVLDRTISVETTDGMMLQMEDAEVDLNSGTLKTPNPIVGASPQADITASSMSVLDNGNRILFIGNVNMTIRPKRVRERETTREWQLRNTPAE